MRIALLLTVLVGGTAGLMLVPSPPPTAAPATAPTAPATAPTAPATVNGEAMLDRDRSGHFLATAEINGHPVRMLVDTGATAVALTPADARAAGLSVDPGRWRRIGRTASGAAMGEPLALASVRLGAVQRMDVEAMVVDGLPVSLLGQSFLRRLDIVEIRGDRMTLR